jgi:hypothetical protein
MSRLKAIWGGTSRSSDTTEDALEPLIREAMEAERERRRILGLIEQAQARQAEAEQDLRTASSRQIQEEYEAAQTEGGLAIASDETLAAVADAELRIKTANLRRQKLMADLTAANGRITAAWEAAQAAVMVDLRQAADEIGKEFDAIVWRTITLLRKSVMLLRHRTDRPQFNNTPGMVLYNPWASEKGVFIDCRLASFSDGSTSLEDWKVDAEACALDEAIRGTKDRIAPIGELVKKISS